MASTEITTATDPRAVTQLRSLVRAGSRLYWFGEDTVNLTYEYSDDDGATWIGSTVISADEVQSISAVYDAVNGRINIAYANANTADKGLKFRAIASNVTSGSPGALTTETVIDAGGASLGVWYPHIVHSATGTNPRYWIVAEKQTGAGAYVTRAWFVTAGSAADTAGNWATTNFTDIGTLSSAFGGLHMGLAVWWQVAGAEKVTIAFMDGNAGQYRAATFDPTAATPAPPATPPVIDSGYGNIDYYAQGLPIVLAAKADYLVFGALDTDDGNFVLEKSINGVNFSYPATWSIFQAGRATLTKSGPDFYIVYSSVNGPIATTANALFYRKLTATGDGMGAATAFSDTNGFGVTSPLDTGTSKLYVVYRGSTAAPYTVRSDSVLAGQVLLPDADITTTGWTTAPLFSKLNDSSDASVITATAS